MIKEAKEAVERAYKVICISIYLPDLAALDEMVAALRARGVNGTNRSSLIRYALKKVDASQIQNGEL